MFRWDKPIHVEKRVQTANGALTVQKGEATPRAIVFDPFNYRVEDVMNALCITMREVIETIEAQAKSADLARQLREIVAQPPVSRGE